MLKVVGSPPADAAETPRAAPDDLMPLVRQAAAPDPRALRALLVAVGPAMLRAVRKVLGPGARDVEDVVQDAMEALIAALPAFRGDSSVLHFAYRVAVLSALVHRRRLGVRRRWTVDTVDAPDAADEAAHDAAHDGGAPPSEDSVAAARRRQALGMLLDELPAVQAEVLVLHAALGFTVEEIARAVGRPLETIRSRLRLAKGALRERIGADRQLAELLEVRS